MKIALCSLNIAWQQKELNLVKCEKYCMFASIKQADILIFPEMCITGFSFKDLSLSEHINKSVTIEKFKSFAIKYNLNILFGLMTNQKNNYFNSAVFISNKGVIKNVYNKIHLFSKDYEDSFLSPGKNISLFKFKSFYFSVNICYDLRFPELFSAISNKCDLFINIANWPNSRSEHYKILLKARAIENRAFVIGVNRSGINKNGERFGNFSTIVNPEGRKLVPQINYNNLKIFNLDLKSRSKFQKRFDSTKDRKISMYSKLLISHAQ